MRWGVLLGMWTRYEGILLWPKIGASRSEYQTGTSIWIHIILRPAYLEQSDAAQPLPANRIYLQDRGSELVFTAYHCNFARA